MLLFIRVLILRADYTPRMFESFLKNVSVLLKMKKRQRTFGKKKKPPLYLPERHIYVKTAFYIVKSKIYFTSDIII